MRAPEYKVPLAGSERTAVPGFHVVRKVYQSSLVDVSIVLRRRSGDEIPNSIERTATLLPQQRQYLTREQYTAVHGPDPDDVSNVLRFAIRHGLRVVTVNQPARIVNIRGTASAMSRAFNVDLFVYGQSGYLGAKRYRGRTGPVYIPLELDGIVQAVMGLDNRPQAKPQFRRPRQFGGGWSHAGAVSYSPDAVARRYNFPAGCKGDGQAVGLIALDGGYSPRDLKLYLEMRGLPVPQISSVSVGGARNRNGSEPIDRSGEAGLAIQLIAAVAGAANIVVYHAPGTTMGFLEAVSRAIHDEKNKPSILAIGCGSAEAAWTPQSMRILDQAFQAAAIMGVTVCCAAGDRGSSDGQPGRLAHASFPASSPHVLACGGTTLGPAGDETVWNDGPGTGAGGGGVSDFFPLPKWQQKAGIPPSVNPNRHLGRGLPDVSANAGPTTGYDVRLHRTDAVIGGTGASSLLWAGLIACLNQQLNKPLGFLNPLLYERAADAGFTDVTSGHNDLTGRVGAYRAAPGWDACTGWGTPNGARLAEVLE